MQYKENRWFAQINPMNVLYYNEPKSSYVHERKDSYVYDKPSLLMFNMKDRTVPEWSSGEINGRLKDSKLKDLGYSLGNIADRRSSGFYEIRDSDSQKNREEIKLKDKYIKIKIRYSGKYKASIHSILTYYTEIWR